MLELDALIGLMGRTHSIDISPYEPSFLASLVERRLETLGVRAFADYLERLEHDRDEAAVLARSLENHHSEFFRDPLAFALLEQRILPTLAAAMEASGRTELRIWSAGCAAGQEAYSIAILLLELSAERARPVPFRLFATDRSEVQLAEARAASYPATALRNVRLGHAERWFTRHGQTFVATKPLRDRLNFSVHDLLGEDAAPTASIFATFDLVLCCNLLFYYRRKAQQLVLERLRRALGPGAFLLTGDVERGVVLDSGSFRPVDAIAAVFQETT